MVTQQATPKSSKTGSSVRSSSEVTTCPLGITAARRQLTVLREQSFETLTRLLPHRVVIPKGHHWIGWCDSHGNLNSARCEAYTLPRREEPALPFTVRLSINHGYVSTLEEVARKAGIVEREGQAPRPALRPRFELSCLPHEAVGYAAWLGEFLLAFEKNDPEAIPAPPYPTYFWNELDFDCRYAWSHSGWEAMETYHNQRGQVPEAPALATLHQPERNP
jgi:hypothetical protein